MKAMLKLPIGFLLILNLIALVSVKSYGQLSPSFGKITQLQFSDLDFKKTIEIDSKKNNSLFFSQYNPYIGYSDYYIVKKDTFMFLKSGFDSRNGSYPMRKFDSTNPNGVSDIRAALVFGFLTLLLE
jgi:hypothetical protein